AFKRELMGAGIDVIDVGVLHSPGLYFSVFHLETDGGVMITASHNPSEDNGFKIVSGRSTIDGGNGTGGLSALPVLKKLGVETEAIYCDPDGRFPNHHPDPTVPENLQALIARVKATGAELGIALDGDADRIGAVDGQGRILWGD